MPLAEVTRSIYEINAVFPSLVGSLACEAPRERPLDVVFVGSIADGSPSCFGPVYHASKIALHYFVTGVGPIAEQSRPGVRLRLFRPGVIRGPLSWAPVLRLNQRGRRIRARRCEAAPSAEVVAEQVVRFVESGRWVGSPDEPLSFRALRLLFALAPDLTFRLQRAAWRRASRFVEPRAGAAPAAEAGRGLPGPRLGT
jgi:short-subunit dehydrogenase